MDFFTKFVAPLQCDNASLSPAPMDNAYSCITNLGIVLLICIIAAFLTMLLVLALVIVICCMAHKIKKLNSSIEEGKDGGKDSMRLKGILENPLYTDLPMNTDFESGGLIGQDPSYHETQGKETAVSYETVPSQLPSQQLTANYDDVVIDNYHLLGEDEYTKNKVGPPTARIPADDYDDIILPNRDVVGQDKEPRSHIGYGKPAAPPPTEVKGQVLEYCVVTEGAKVIVQGGGQMEYDHLIHKHQHSASTSTATKPKQLLEGYSKLADARQHSSTVGERPQVAWEKDSSHPSKGSRDLPAGVVPNRMKENEGAEILYRTVPKSLQGVDASLYMNVKH